MIKYILCASILLCVSACNIDEEIIDRPSDSNITTETEVTNLVRGTYASLQDQSCFKYQGMQLMILCADDFYSVSGGFSPFSTRIYNSTNVAVQTFWTSTYAAIRNANNLITTLDRLDLPQKFENQSYGEAYFLRAVANFYLVRMFGGVPLRTTSVDINSNFYAKRNTVAEVYEQIFKDLKAASTLLPLQSAIPSTELGRASKGAAQAILAKAYLTYGNYQSFNSQDPTPNFKNALLYADSVVKSNQYALLNDFGDLFDLNKETAAYKEVIFGMRYIRDNVRTSAGSTGSEYAARFMPNIFSDVCGAINGVGQSDFRVHPYIADFYSTGEYLNDYRFEKTYANRGFNKVTNRFSVMYPFLRKETTDNSTNFAAIQKYIDGNGRDGRNHENDLFVVRLADVYLMIAEAENELNGPTAAAYTAFNTVRERARKANGVVRTTPANLAPALSKIDFRLKVFHERGAELIGEGHRWFDLVRMKSPTDPTKTMFEYQFFTVLPKQPQTLPTYNATTNKWSTVGAVLGTHTKPELKHLLQPIPLNEITGNPNFGGQNPGW
jgi:hypothetical protein